MKNSTITADRTTHLGGLIAYAKDTTTSGNSVIGTEDSPVIVTGEEAQYAGGIVGYAENCTFGSETSPDKVTLVKVIANDSSGNNQGTGAFAGYIKNSSIISPEVTYASATGRYAGGIAGQTEALSMGSEDYVISGAKVKSNESYQISGQWAGGIAGINEGCILNPVVNTVYVSADSHGGQAGGIAGENLGTITSTLASANVDFALISGNDSNYYIFTSLGGAAGENKGTISGIKVGANTKITSTKEGQLYAGGIAGYNEYESYYGFVYPGKIDENNSVEKITIDCTGGRYGYVVGMNKLGDVSDDIKNAYSESTSVSEANNGSTSASEISSKSSYVPITLTRTSKVTLTVTDASGGAAVYGGIATSSDADIDVSETNSTVLAYTGKTDGTTVTVSAGYLTEGTYYIVLQSSEDSWNLSAEGNSVTYTID